MSVPPIHYGFNEHNMGFPGTVTVEVEHFMDYVYDPHVQALIEDYNAYVCPVPDARAIILNQLNDPTVANSPTVFPDAAQVAKSKPYYQFQGSEDLDTWNNTFEPIYTG